MTEPRRVLDEPPDFMWHEKPRRAKPRHGSVFWWVVFLAGGFAVYCFGTVVIVLLARAGVLP